MDQLKEILKQAIKYRFWIAVGVSALLPMIAYLVGSGPIQKKADDEGKAITSAEKDVKQYASGTIPNGQYKGIVAEKTEELTKDVNDSWKKLYARQAPLLTWPERVQDRFRTWGRKWPTEVDASTVQLTIIDYVNVYPAFVTEVYKSFKPFDPIEGTGIVSAAPEAVLLRPATFTQEAPPSLGKVWAAQERLWIQRTLLDVVAQVNKNAKNWDGAIIKQINALEVGTALAQDQRSIAKGDTLEESAAINDPSKPAEDTSTSTAGAPGMDSGQMAMMMGSMGGGSGAAIAPETVSHIKNDSVQFTVLPVHMTVLIEQDHIQDFLVGLENSPMTIQVMDFEMSKPSARVTKPEKGNSMMFGGEGMMMGMGGYPGMGGMMPGGMEGYGGRMSGGYAGMMGSMAGGYGMGGMPGMMGMGAAAPERKGVDARTKTREADAKKRLEAATKKVMSTLHDPYYNIVEVKVYGQARFFNPPPVDAPADPSQAEAAPTTDTPKAETPKAEGEAEKKTESPKAEGEAEKKTETPKAEAEKKTESPKAEAEKKTESPKAEAPK
jgi:hypothetical protein